MIRIVSLRKAAAAGAAAAIAWEIVLRGLDWAGFPLFDVVRSLGTLAFPDGPDAAWWAVGMIGHLLVGALWAIFYAYFFWSWFDWRPPVQGMVFALLPAALASFLVVPQVELMHRASSIVEVSPATFLQALSWREAAGILVGHLIFGAVMGAIYVRPVGYADERPPRPAKPRSGRAAERQRPRRVPNVRGFMFATGIECSYPTIEGGRWRRDQMHATGHYRRWAEDLELAREVGVTHLRYGPPLHLIWQAPGRYDWTLVDEVMADLEAWGPEPIVDLCHFGLPSWLGDFQNSEAPQALAEYAGAFAERYGWVRFYTPVNEMYVCGRLSALDGGWNEQREDDGAFVSAIRNMARASVSMTDCVLRQRPDAVFVNSESGEYYQPCCPDPEIQALAEFENERRFLPLDLLYAHEVSEKMRQHLREQGMADEEYRWFMERQVPRRTVLGVDYYEWNEKLIDHEGQSRALGELFGWYVIASHYYQRYGRPMMHTETNRLDARDGPRWLWRQWHNVQLMRRAGVPLVGFTWYSLIDQVDWDIALTRALGNVNPVGLYDLNRDVRPVGLAYKNLIETHRDVAELADCPAVAELLA